MVIPNILDKITILGANAMAAVMDFGVGALLAVALSLALDITLTPWTFLVGGFLALLPDMDVVPHIFSLRLVQFDHHQTLFHQPLLVLPLVSAIAYAIAEPGWAVIAVVCVFYYYLHDTEWTRHNMITGITWLWPFSEKCWSWFGSYPRPQHMQHRDWLEKYWLKPTTRSLLELSIGFTTLLLAIYLAGFYSLYIVAIPLLMAVGTAFVWVTAPRLSRNNQTVTPES